MASVNCEGSSRRRRDKPWTPSFCTIVEVDTSGFSYLACSSCERPLREGSVPNPPACPVCPNKCALPTASKRLYRLLLSISIVDEVIPVMCFDRAARVLIGCSADDLFDFSKCYPLAGEKIGEILEGEMCQMTLCEPKNGNAQHLRVVSVIPLRTGFRPVINRLRLIFGVADSHQSKMSDSTQVRGQVPAYSTWILRGKIVVLKPLRYNVSQFIIGPTIYAANEAIVEPLLDE